MEYMNGKFLRGLEVVLTGLSALIVSAGASWAGVIPVPAPLVGATGPLGLLAAGIAYGGYLFFKRFRNRS
jgi:hypothetical protein